MTDYLKQLQQIENYIKDAIEGNYPLKVTKFIQYDNPDKNSLVGIFVANNNKKYSFYIDKSNPLPQLKPVN